MFPFKPVLKALKKVVYHTRVVRDLDPTHYDLVVGTIRTAKQDFNVNGGTHIGYVKNANGHFRYTDILPAYYEWKAFKSSRGIIAHSRMVIEEIKTYYKITPEKIHLLYPPVNEARYNLAVRKRRSEIIAQYQIDPKKFTVFFPSTNHKIKGLSNLLSAFKKLPSDQFELIIAGAPIDSQPEASENIRYLGYLSRIEDFYAACDITILPSFYDGFGLTVTESIACGTPVIVSKKTGASELIDRNHGLILEDYEPETIAQTIKTARDHHFLIDPDFLQKNGLTLKQHIDALKKLAENMRA